MRKEEKSQLIDELVEQLRSTNHFYIADSSGMSVEDTNKLRSICFRRNVKMQVVKNTLMRKAMEKLGVDYGELYQALIGPSAIFFSQENNAPAKLIKEFRGRFEKPVLKGAWVEENVYLGDNQLDALVNVRSRDQLIGDIILQLQSPANNVISALLGSGHKLAGILKTMSEKE
ncbi:MAG: 50S ribosomal protein L10 [Bacteroidetes bacterium]|nr:50S ribosomal protein L10 [Bacteroidota bacterium]MBU1719454.1 50S ribosomal protein L10 [Bacteroidota bacterium]